MKRFSKSARVFYRANKGLIISSIVVLILAGSVGLWYYQRTAPARERARIVRQQEMVAGIIAKGNIDQCAEARGIIIEGVDYETVCKNNIHIDRAYENNDLSACEKLDNNLIQVDLCKQRVIVQAIMSGTNKDICEANLSDPLKLLCLETYWTEQAVARDDIALCNQLPESHQNARCKDNVLIEELVFKKKPTSCDAFSKSLQSGCELFKKNVSHAPTNSTDCSISTSRVFESLCVNREYIHNATLAP